MDKALIFYHNHSASKKLLDIFRNWPQTHIILKAENQTFNFLDAADSTIFSWRPPFIYPLTDKTDLSKYPADFTASQFTSLILLIEAGQAALGIFNPSGCRRHKVIRKYMTRKGQGKAQITYLNQKGKSRAGSRIRLTNTVEFFEEISAWINEQEPEFNPASILYHTTPVLWGMMFEKRFRLNLEKSDRRFRKIPVYINQNTYKTLFYVYRQSHIGQIQFYNSEAAVLPDVVKLCLPPLGNIPESE
jgi:hypothetical protein